MRRNLRGWGGSPLKPRRLSASIRSPPTTKSRRVPTMDHVRKSLSYANVMATVAVFVALGGSSYAALTITGKNVKNSSLTGADIKNSSLTTSDVKNRSLLARDFKTGQLPAGPKGDQGPKGDKGDRGDPGPFPGTLPSGTTLRGAYYAFGQATGTFQA